MAGLLKHLIEEELKRNLSSQARLSKILVGLPKGKLFKRKIGRKIYYYLNRRVPDKPHPESKYIGMEGSELIDKISKQVVDRARIKKQLADLKIELKMLDKALHEYRKSH